MLRLCAFLLMLPLIARAEGEDAGTFDYYVMALSWNASWCALEGDKRGADQCDTRHDYGFTLHGLWPQFERGWPSFCRTVERDPSRGQTRAMADIMGSDGLAWHQWKKHGRCSGLSAADYYDLSREAYERIERPGIFRQLQDSVRLPPKVVEEAFLEVNEALLPGGVTVTCKGGLMHEVRICLNRDLSPRICGRDVQRDCSAPSVGMDPVR